MWSFHQNEQWCLTPVLIPRITTRTAPNFAYAARIQTISSNCAGGAAIKYSANWGRRISASSETIEVYGLASIKDIKIGGSTKSHAKSHAKGPSKGASKASANAEKELQRLRRMDLLELLLDEIRKNEENTAKVQELSELTERLKAKLDDKDAQIERLKAKLNDKDAEIDRLLVNNEAAAHARGMLDVDELLKVERKALEAYFARVAEETRTQTWEV